MSQYPRKVVVVVFVIVVLIAVLVVLVVLVLIIVVIINVGPRNLTLKLCQNHVSNSRDIVVVFLFCCFYCF